MELQVVFICAFVFLAAGLLCIWKETEKLNFFRSLVVCYITELCLGAVIAGIYSVVGIPVQLLSMGIGYFLLAIPVWARIIYQKKLQKYKIELFDIYAVLIITVFFAIMFFKVFTPDILIVYKNSDPGTHYGWALKILDTKKVSSMYFAPLYNSLVMELFQPFLTRISLYKAFILADSFSNYINILMFYVILSNILKAKPLKVLAPFVCILYFLGWPFYSYVAGGYVYFGVGITLVAYVVYLLTLLKRRKDKTGRVILFSLIVLGIFNVTICYMLFMPILCVAIFFCLWDWMREEKIVIPPRMFKIAVMGLSFLAVVLFCICYFGYFKGDIGRIFTGIQNEGGIHRELYKDFLFMLPPVIYMGWYYFKHDKPGYIYITMLTNVIITGVAFIACVAGIISGYYYYKLYYLIWFFLWLVCAEAAEHFIKGKKIVLWAYGFPVLLAAVLMWVGMDDFLAKHNLNNGDSPSLFPIYEVSKTYMEESEETPEMESLRSVSSYINENFPEVEKGIPLISSVDKFNYGAWYKAFTGYRSFTAERDSSSDSGKTLIEVIQRVEEEGFFYFLILKTADCYQGNEELLNAYERVYDDGYWGIYKCEKVR